MKITKENWAQLLVVIIITFFLFLIVFGKVTGKSGAPGGPGGPGGAPGAGAPGGAPGGAKGGGGMPGAPGGAPQDAAANTVTVSAKTVKPETIIATVHVNGDVSSKSEVSTFPITSGKITQVRYDIGDKVTKNDIIAYVDPSKPGANYVASPVKAPVSGTIIECNVHPGDTVGPNTVIATIGSVTDIEVVVYVSKKYSKYLKQGLPAYLYLTAYADEKFLTRIASISPVVAKNTRTIKVSLELEKYDARIKPGMFASIDLVIQQRDNTIVVPKRALRTFNDEQCVFVINPATNTAERVIVTVGLTNDNEAQITSGLTAGQKVITAGSVTEGCPVRIADES
ncbi:MAG: efflux RND transporter periplasmic adaptor subunit [Spirochaetaceae bacterium]|nr:efflux RND transporter periplasmic adaptor subunit [Spirochaetaceae bacterium]